MKILFQGDSITDGARLKDPAKAWDKNHQIGHSYAFVISGKLGYEEPAKFEFVNRGISGNSVRQLEARWNEDALDINPDLLSILVGINGNGRNSQGIYEGDFDAHLRTYDETYRRILAMSRAKNPDLKIVIIEPFALPVGIINTDYKSFYPKFSRIRETAKKIAEDYGAAFVSIQDELERLAAETGDASIWLWDGVHPTERCHWLLANRWLEAAAHLL